MQHKDTPIQRLSPLFQKSAIQRSTIQNWRNSSYRITSICNLTLFRQDCYIMHSIITKCYPRSTVLLYVCRLLKMANLKIIAHTVQSTAKRVSAFVCWYNNITVCRVEVLALFLLHYCAVVYKGWNLFLHYILQHLSNSSEIKDEAWFHIVFFWLSIWIPLEWQYLSLFLIL